MDLQDWLVWVHAFTTFAMTGLIWFVQVVHYPMLARYPEEGFHKIAREHCDRTGFVVAPLMLVEVATAGLLLFAGWHQPLFLVSLGFLALIWGSTAFVQVPIHRRLLQGRNDRALKHLVATNGLRTLGWSARSACLLMLFS